MSILDVTNLVRELFFLPKSDILRGDNSSIEFFYTMEINGRELDMDLVIGRLHIENHSIAQLKVTIIKTDRITGTESFTLTPTFKANVLRESREVYATSSSESYYV